MIKNLQAQLSRALTSRTLVRIERSLENGCVDGYVVAVAKKWVVMLVLGDGITFVGYQAYRLKDVASLTTPAPYAAFQEAVIRKRKLRRTVPRGLDLSSTLALLSSANAKFPLISIYCEEKDADLCHIGRVAATSRTSVVLNEVTPSATWESGLSTYPLTQITRIDFGGLYEEALALVAGSLKREVRRKA
jgi:hypothetical protein